LNNFLEISISQKTHSYDVDNRFQGFEALEINQTSIWKWYRKQYWCWL